MDALKVWFKRGIQKTSEQAEGPTLNTVGVFIQCCHRRVSHVFQNVIDVKRKLDKLLAEWRPKDFQVHRQDAKGTNPEVRVRLSVDFLDMDSCETSAHRTRTPDIFSVR